MVSGVQNFGMSAVNPYFPTLNEVNYYGNQSNPFLFGSQGNNFDGSNFYQQNQKVGFWEGTKAFFKGIVRPIKNIIQHPIKSALFIAGTAALIIGTGGAATPFLIGAGVALGGWQMAKGAYNAITSDNKYQTLAALEDMGEGTFTLGASVAGAKSYASSTCAGSATSAAANETTFGSKFLAYTKGLSQDTFTTLKAVPKSAETSLNMIASGEFAGNLQSYAASAKLAAQHRNLARVLQMKRPDYGMYKNIYDTNLKAYELKYGMFKPNQIANRYMDLYEKFGFDSINEAGTQYINNPQLSYIASIRALKNNINVFRNLPEVNMALGYNSAVNIDPEIESAAYTYLPYCLN